MYLDENWESINPVNGFYSLNGTIPEIKGQCIFVLWWRTTEETASTTNHELWHKFSMWSVKTDNLYKINRERLYNEDGSINKEKKIELFDICEDTIDAMIPDSLITDWSDYQQHIFQKRERGGTTLILHMNMFELHQRAVNHIVIMKNKIDSWEIMTIDQCMKYITNNNWILEDFSDIFFPIRVQIFIQLSKYIDAVCNIKKIVNNSQDTVAQILEHRNLKNYKPIWDIHFKFEEWSLRVLCEEQEDILSLKNMNKVRVSQERDDLDTINKQQEFHWSKNTSKKKKSKESMKLTKSNQEKLIEGAIKEWTEEIIWHIRWWYSESDLIDRLAVCWWNYDFFKDYKKSYPTYKRLRKSYSKKIEEFIEIAYKFLDLDVDNAQYILATIPYHNRETLLDVNKKLQLDKANLNKTDQATSHYTSLVAKKSGL